MLVERIKSRVADQRVEILVVQEEKWVPPTRVQQPTVEHAPVPQILEETVVVVKCAPRERVRQRTTE